MKNLNRNMSRIGCIILCSLLLASCGSTTDASDTSAAEAETAAETEIITTTASTETEQTAAESSAAAQEETSEPESTEVTYEASQQAQEPAETYAAILYENLSPDNVHEYKDVLYPYTDYYTFCATDDSDFMALESDVIFCDTNADDVPEMLIGGHGNIGLASYDIFDLNGTELGCFTGGSGFYKSDMGILCLYVTMGKYSFYETLLNSNITTISAGGHDSEKNVYSTVTISVNNAITEQLTDVDEDTLSSLYLKYFGVSDTTEFYSSNDSNAVHCVYGSLIVPDPDNYTEEDIYNCLLPLLTEYYETAAED